MGDGRRSLANPLDPSASAGFAIAAKRAAHPWASVVSRLHIRARLPARSFWLNFDPIHLPREA